MKIKDMTNKQLKEAYYEYNYIINLANNGAGCYGVKDIMMLEALEKEINDRGGEIENTKRVRLNEKKH